MAKQALLDVLEQTIGKYVLNLDAESLNLAIWSGKIELKALLLDCDAVNAELSRKAVEAPNLAVPFKVVAGQFEHFEVSVPWAHLMSKPVVVRASGLTVSVVPFDRSASADYLLAVHENESVRAEQIKDDRIKSLRMADDFRKQADKLRGLAEQDLETAKNASSGSNNSNSSFAARLVRRIIENIQVEITNVSVMVKGSESSAGLTLKSLSLMTTDNCGNRTYVDRSKGPDKAFLYKALQIDSLSIFLDENKSKMMKLPSIGEETDEDSSLHSYLLAPLSFEAKLRQADSNNCVEYPKYLLESELNSLSVYLSRRQLELGSKMADQIRPSEIAATPLFPEYRPLKRVTKETASDWWKYANRCVGRLNGRRSWVEFFRAFKSRKAYIPLYKRHAHHAKCSWIQPLSTKELTVLDDIERDRSISVEGIMAWRSIGDAQMKKELEKHEAKKAKEKGSLYTSIFGGNEETQDEAPISLSVDELRELEAATMDQMVDAELSADSRLCDIIFVLGSLRFNLSSYDDRPLTSLELGKVSTSFDAHKDGSFGFYLALTSLEVEDLVTPKSLFPYILRNQKDAEVSDDKAFRVNLTKTKTGDQELQVKLSTFEAVASPSLLVELKQLFSLSAHRRAQGAEGRINPLLAQSLSGSVDLFYDAADGGMEEKQLLSTEPLEDVLPHADGNRDQGSNVLMEAWKTKTKLKASWSIDFDIDAPILVIPENCTAPLANILVFDLGHLKFQYGKVETPTVASWFHENQRLDRDSSDLVMDGGLLQIRSLTFVIGKSNYWHRLVSKCEIDTGSNKSEAIVQPISLSFEFGVECCQTKDIPRIGAFGLLPSISLTISPSQISRFAKVSNAWQKVLDTISPESDEDEAANDEKSKSSRLSEGQHARSLAAVQRLAISSAPDSGLGVMSVFHVDFRLQRLSVKVIDDHKKGIEAHLVAVSASTSHLSDGSSFSNVSMGWFWILDRFENKFPRMQRLLVNSELPLPPDEFAKEDKYDVLGELEKQKVFELGYDGSVDLADISIKRVAPTTQSDKVDPFDCAQPVADECDVSLHIDARFTSLYITWNPRAVKVLTSMLSTLIEPLTSSSEKEQTDNIILSSPKQLMRQRNESFDSLNSILISKSRPSNVLIKASMDMLQVSLNSARDDLPLFVGTMASTRLSYVSSDDNNTRLHLSLGELKLESAPYGKTHPSFRTILGSSSGDSSSLLSVAFSQGERAVSNLIPSSEKIDLSDIETYAEVELSSARLVYVQSQVLTLVEYATEGILGALAAQAASSAAAVAADLTAPSESKKLFRVKATGFELFLPQSACKTLFVSSQLESLAVDFSSLPDSSSEVSVTLQNLFMIDTCGNAMLQAPVQVNVFVVLPPLQATMDVNVAISKANFILTKAQYAQLISTLSENIGEEDLFVRIDPGILKDASAEEIETLRDNDESAGLTHAGAAIADESRPIDLRVAIDTLSISLCGEDEKDPLAKISAVDSLVQMKTDPEAAKTSFRISLRDLVCEDQRLKALDRQYRTLIHQPPGSEAECEDSVCFITYETIGDDLSSLDLKVGSPRIVFIPDAVSDLLKYISSEHQIEEGVDKTRPVSETYHNVVHVESSGENGVETSFVREPTAEALCSIAFRLTTSHCSVLLVDLGSDSLRQQGSLAFMPVESVAETLAISGVFEAQVDLKKEKDSGEVVKLDSQFHGDKIEAFTALGRDLRSAVQILDPTQVSLYYNSKTTLGMSQSSDIRCAIISPVDITLSMRNVALFNAIVTSINDCVEEERQSPSLECHELSEQETTRIEKLSSVLEAKDTDTSTHSEASTHIDDCSSRSAKEVALPIMINKTSFKLTTSEMKLSFVNDLQGLDEALLRVNIRTFVANGRTQCDGPATGEASPITSFDFNAHVSILADYFDSSMNLWKVLLLQPWEVGLKGDRRIKQSLKSSRPSSTVDVESLPCHLSFSEQFLMSLASANRMWMVYSGASSSALESLDNTSQQSKSVRRSMAASAARTFITSLPYCIENHTGVPFEFDINADRPEQRSCAINSMEYFRFEPPVGQGSAGKRLYGQDVKFEKRIKVLVKNELLTLPHLDSELGQPKKSHKLGDGFIIVSEVVKEGKTIIVRISSGVEIHNRSSIPFSISLLSGTSESSIGTCNGVNFQSMVDNSLNSQSVLAGGTEQNVRPSKRLGLPVDLLHDFRSEWATNRNGSISLVLSPQIDDIPEGWTLNGSARLRMNENTLSSSQSNHVTQCFDVTCRPLSSNASSEEEAPRDLFPFVLQVRVSMMLVSGNHPSIELSLEPRATLTNRMPIKVSIKTPMPHVFGRHVTLPDIDEVANFGVEQNGHLEIFTSGPSIAVSMKCAETPVGGTPSDWVNGGWIDLPLVSEFRMQEPLPCVFPFVRKANHAYAASGANGSEFFIAEGSEGIANLSSLSSETKATPEDPNMIELAAPPSGNDDWREFFITVMNYAVDHTGDILFEQIPPASHSSGYRNTTALPLGAYSTGRYHRRVSLLPSSRTPIRLLHLTMEGDDGVQKSAPFSTEDISICNGGINSTLVKWKDGSSSGFFAYRQLVSPYQSEIHVIPEYVVFNGSLKHPVLVKQPGGLVMMIEPGRIAPLRTQSHETAIISIEYPGLSGHTRPIRVDASPLQIVVVKSTRGIPIGSFALQTIVGATDSRWVVKLGDVNFGSVQQPEHESLFRDDFIRFSIKWSELQMTLNEARRIKIPADAVIESAFDRIQNSAGSTDTNTPDKKVAARVTSPAHETWIEARQRRELESKDDESSIGRAVCTILFHRFTVDWQRVFKDINPNLSRNAREALESPERSQLSIVIHNVRIRDETPDSPYPIVFDSFGKTSFLDLCVRFRGETNSDLVKIDLIDLNLAHVNGNSEKIYVRTSEDFVWKVLDLADRILAAAAEFAGVDIKLKWDDEQEGYVVAVSELSSLSQDETSKYTPPKSDKMYNIRKTRVSPFKLVVSFKRNPEKSRYALMQGGKRANVMNYFTRKLKFKIEMAVLNFHRYEVNDVKGPPDRIIELLSAVYMARMKSKILSIVTASSFQDWKFLTQRDDGNDEYLEGDILRATGNIAGNSVGYAFKHAGRGLGNGVSNMTSTLGQGIESATGAIGVGVVGAGVNSVVSGLGDGVGDTISGVGSGAGKILKGAGQGVGHIFGGVTGGATQMGKGIGKGIKTGSGKAVASGLKQGAESMRSGVGQGVESVVSGTAEGVLHVGKGLFSGVRHVGRGIGGAFVGKSPPKKKKDSET